MKNITSILAAIGVALSATLALATDLPSYKTAPALEIHSNPFYAGVNGGWSTNSSGFTLGATAGYDFGYVRLEGDYRNIGLGHNATSFVTGNVLTGNVILQYPLGKFEPYVLAGYGYAWRPYNASTGVWNVGGGSRYALTQNVALDLRYTFTEGVRSSNPVNNSITGGVEYRF